MPSSRTARKLASIIGATVVSTLLVGGTVAATSNDDAGRGIKASTSISQGRGI